MDQDLAFCVSGWRPLRGWNADCHVVFIFNKHKYPLYAVEWGCQFAIVPRSNCKYSSFIGMISPLKVIALAPQLPYLYRLFRVN